MSRHLHHGEVFLRNQVSFHTEAKLIPSGSGKDQGGYIDPEIRDLQAIADGNRRKGCATDKLLVVEIG